MTRPIALVTGSSAGIGAAFAELLARDGHDLVLVARRRDRLESLAQRLSSEHSARSEILIADLGTPAGVQALATRAAAGPLDLVVNNAGFGAYGPFVTIDPAIADRLLSVHVSAVVQLSRAVLPGMLERGRGGIINVASLLALSGSAPPGPFLPARTVYAGAKSFLLTFSQILATELAETPIRVQVCLPGLVKTEFHEVQGIDTARLPQRMSAEDVARASLAALSKGEVVCIPALEDASDFDRIGEAQRGLLGVARKSEIAARYR